MFATALIPFRLTLLPALFLAAWSTAPLAAQEKLTSDTRGVFTDLARASALLSAGKAKEAQQLLEAIVEQAPGTQGAWQQLALAHSAQRNEVAALKAIEHAVSLGSQASDVLLMAAELSWKQKPKEAKQWAVQAAKQDPQRDEIQQQAIAVLVKLKAFDEAKGLLEGPLQKAAGNEAKREAVWWLEAELAIGCGKPEAAAEAYRKIIGLKGDRDPFPHESLANVLVHIGKKPEALAAMQKALAIHPSSLTMREREIELMKELKAPKDELARAEQLLVFYQKASKQLSIPPSAGK